MAYYAALASLLQLMEDILHHNTYTDVAIAKQEAIIHLYEKLRLLHSSLKDYSSKGAEAEGANDSLERRIRDVSHKAQDIIESRISNLLRLENDEEEEDDCERVLDLEELIAEFGSISDEVAKIKKTQQIHLHQVRVLRYDARDQGTDFFRQTVVGFDDQIMAIKERLCSNSSKLLTVPIVGAGGIGKTTLAKFIFNDKLTVESFPIRAWVTVSKDYDRLKMLSVIQCSLDNSYEPFSCTSEAELTLCIHKHLKGRTYLIVLDDVWSNEVLDDVRRVLPDDCNRSRIVLTTRLLQVASYAAPDSSSSPPHQMSFLNTEESWNLLRTKVFDQDECPGYLEDVGRFIAEKCGGLPLAIVVIAGVLTKAGRTRREWEEVARNVSSTVIEKNEDFSKILHLSYNHLPHDLKPCFLYLGGFLQGREISVSRLAMLWIAEGFISPIESKTLEQVALEKVEDLVKRNLVSKKKENYDGKVKSCAIIHDLLRDLCVERVKLEDFFHITDENGDFNAEKLKYTRRASLCYSLNTCRVRRISPYTRAVISLLKEEWMQAFSLKPSETYKNSSLTFASTFKVLRIWDALEVKYNSSFPNEILGLIHLRYLAFRLDYCYEQRSLKIPKTISNLRNLQTLIIGFEVHLPSEIWKMKQLRHVIAYRIIIEPVMDSKKFALNGLALDNLQTLFEVKGFVFTSKAVEMMPNLQTLKAIYTKEKAKKWNSYRLDNIVRLSKLEKLELYFQTTLTQKRDDPFPESFAFPEKLKKLSLHGCRLPWADMRAITSLPNLEVLKLKCNSFQGDTWELDEEDEFQRLKILLMDQLEIKHWAAERTLTSLALRS